ncbi:MAG: hypothetical protein GF416_01040 [Candidatus Altiarchaeales archaeon]|nr:hypothetical protein [Candidatus Altiarchaeales archaeon]MBD3415701.1 hypothetical protein [Candidatus Altiarchaeales archaeon]
MVGGWFGKAAPIVLALAALLSYSQFYSIQYAEFDTIAKIVTFKGGLEELPRILTTPEQQYMLTTTNYRPVASLILWAMHLLFGLNLTPYHLLLYLLHAANTVLAYALAVKLIKDRRYAFLASLVYAVHPIHLQTVIFISRLPDMLVALSSLLTILSLMKYVKSSDERYYKLSILACGLGIFSKASGGLIVILAFLYLTLYDGGWRKALKKVIPHTALFMLYLPMMYLALGRMAGYYGLPDSEWHFGLLNYIFGLAYPTNFTDYSLFQIVYKAALPPAPNTILLLASAAALALSIKAALKDRTAAFALAWLLTFLAAFMSPYVIVSPWYLYTPAIPFTILTAYVLKRSLESKNHAKKLPAAFIAVICAGLIFYSPLLSDYPEPRQMSQLIESLNDHTLEAAVNMPVQSSLYLFNYPDYMVYTGKGYPYSLFIVSEASLQALLDYHMPEKDHRVHSVTAVRMRSQMGQPAFTLKSEQNCYFLATNQNRRAAELRISERWNLNRQGMERISVKQQKTPESEHVMVTFPEKTYKNTYLLVYTGDNIEIADLSIYCTV